MSYDLTREPWIPVLGRDLDEMEMSLRDVFTHAQDLRRVSAAPATVEAALVRLLLAIVHDAIDGPADDAAWARLWRDGLPTETITDYLDEHQDSFDLLHPATPFLQSPGLTLAHGPSEVDRLLPDVGAGRGMWSRREPVPLGHRRTLGFAEAARAVVHAHHADVSGIKPGAAGDPRAKGGKAYPLGPGWGGRAGHVIIHGANLAETLLLNLIPTTVAGDGPVWRRPPLTAGPSPEPLPTGPRSLYTWPSRRILLAHDGHRVDGVSLTYGDPITADDATADPMTAWKDRNGREVAARADYDRVPLWRHWPAWTATPVGEDARALRAAPVAAHLARQVHAGTIEPSLRLRPQLLRVRLGTQESVVEDIDTDEAALPAWALTTDGATAVADAAHIAWLIVRAVTRLAHNLAQARGDSEGAGPKRDASQAAWEIFDGHDGLARQWLTDLTPSMDTGEHLRAWRAMAHDHAWRLGQDMINQTGVATWTGRVLELHDRDWWLQTQTAERRFRSELNWITSQTTPTPSDDVERVEHEHYDAVPREERVTPPEEPKPREQSWRKKR